MHEGANRERRWDRERYSLAQCETAQHFWSSCGTGSWLSPDLSFLYYRAVRQHRWPVKCNAGLYYTVFPQISCFFFLKLPFTTIISFLFFLTFKTNENVQHGVSWTHSHARLLLSKPAPTKCLLSLFLQQDLELCRLCFFSGGRGV